MGLLELKILGIIDLGLSCEILLQIQAAVAFATDGKLRWNKLSVYCILGAVCYAKSPE